MDLVAPTIMYDLRVAEVSRPFGQLLRDHLKGAADLAQQVRKFSRTQRFLWIDDHIRGYSGNGTSKPNRLPQTPFHPIAVHRSSQNAAYGITNSQLFSLRPPQVKHGHMGGEMAASLLVDSLKIRMPQKPSTAGIFLP